MVVLAKCYKIETAISYFIMLASSYTYFKGSIPSLTKQYL